MKGCCPGCEQENVELVRHHWYDDESHRSGHWIYVCRSCNMRLTSDGGNKNHVLPDWSAQKSILMGVDPGRVMSVEEWRLQKCLRGAETENFSLREELARLKGRSRCLEEQVEAVRVYKGATLLHTPRS